MKTKGSWPLLLILVFGLVLMSALIKPLAYTGAIFVLIVIFWPFIEEVIVAVRARKGNN